MSINPTYSMKSKKFSGDYFCSNPSDFTGKYNVLDVEKESEQFKKYSRNFDDEETPF